MTPEQKSLFRDKGYLFLKGALDRSRVAPIREYVFDELKRLKIWSSGKTLSSSVREMPAFRQIAKLSTLIKRNDLQSEVITPDVRSAIVELAQGKVIPAQSQLLISLPNQGEWTLTGLNWHTDISPSGRHPMPGVQAFILIDDVKPRGGATLAIAGSHLHAGRGESSGKAREILRRSDDIESALRGHDLSIVEMSGSAGDIYLMDMRLLHTPSINATNKVRVMATVRYLPGNV